MLGVGYSFPYISNIVFIGLAATAGEETIWKQVTGNKIRMHTYHVVINNCALPLKC
jgi:hypothetical protein